MSLAKFLDGRRASFTGSKPVDMGRMRAPTGRGGPSSASGRRASQKSGTSTSYGASHSANKGSLQSSGKVQGLVQSIQQQNQLNQQNQMMQQNQSSQNQNSLSPSNLLSPAGLSNVLNRSNRSDRSQSKSKQNSPDRGQNQQNQNQNDKKNNNNNESSTKASPSVSPRNNNNANLNTSNKMNTDSQDKNNNNNNVPGTSISVKAQTLVKAVNNNNTNWKPGPQSHMGLDSSSGLEDTEDEKRKGSSSNQKKPGGPTLGLGTGYNNAQSSTQGPKITLANPSVDSSTTAGDRTSNTNSNLNNTINTSTTQSGMNFSYSHGSIENISDVWSYMTGGPESLWKGNLKDSPGFHGLKINNKCFVGKHNSGKPVAIGKGTFGIVFLVNFNSKYFFSQGTFGIVFLGEFHQEWLDARQDSLGQNMLRHIRGPLVLKRQVEVGRSSKVANETQALALLTLAMCSPAGGINGQYDGDPIPPPNRLVPLAFGYFRSLNSEGIRKHHLLTEYAPGGDFHRVLKNTTFTERQLTIVTHQILHAVHFCHYNGIIHRDIKTHNFLISRFGNIQLGDFGLSYCCVLQNNGQNELTPFQRLKKAKLFKFVGTVVFCAPEQRATLKNFDVYDAKFVTADPLLLSDPMLASEDGENNKGQIDPLLHQQQVLDNNPNLSYYDYRADIFACGVVLFNAWSRGIPGMSPLEKSAFEKAMHQAQKNHESKRRQLRFELVKLLDERQSNVQTIRKCALKDFPAEGGRGNPDGSRSPVQQPGINQDSSLSDLMFDLLENNPDSRPQQLDIALKHPCFNQYCKKEFTSTNQFNHITHLSDKDLWDFKVLNNIDLFHIHHFTNAEKDLFANRHDSNLITSRYATVHPQYDLSILKKGLSMKYGPGNSSGGSKSRNNNKYIGTSNDYDNNNNSNINQSGGPGPNRSNANGNNNIRQIQSTDSINSQTGLVDDFTSQENIDDIENRARSIPGIPTRGERDLLDQAVIGNSIHNSIQGMNQKGGKNFSPPSRQGNSNQNNYNNNQRGDNSYQNNNNSQQGFGQQNQNKNNNNNNYRNNNNNNYSNNQQMSNVIDDFNAQGPSGLIQYDEHGNIVAANIPTFEPLIEGENNACCCVNESASSRGWSSLFPWLWRR